MEKGFNDDELADIMNEIESLEKEFHEEPPVDKLSSVDTDTSDVDEKTGNAALRGEGGGLVAEVDPIASEEVVEQEVETTLLEPDSVEEAVSSTEASQVIEEEVIVAEVETGEMSSGVDGEMEEVLEQLSEMESEEVVAKHKAFEDAEVRSFEPPQELVTAKAAKSSCGHSSMSFAVEGDIHLELSFNISGKVVHLNVNENGLELELDGGMKFSIPIETGHPLKKVA